MKRTIAVLALLILASVACMEPVATAAPVSTIQPTIAASPTPLVPTRTATIPTATADADTAQVVRPIVNVRSAPEGEVIGSLSEGDVVTVLQCSGNWCEVETNVLKGYIYQGCLSISDGLGCEAK